MGGCGLNFGVFGRVRARCKGPDEDGGGMEVGGGCGIVIPSHRSRWIEREVAEAQHGPFPVGTLTPPTPEC